MFEHAIFKKHVPLILSRSAYFPGLLEYDQTGFITQFLRHEKELTSMCSNYGLKSTNMLPGADLGIQSRVGTF